ncbi:Fumarylacetoacetate (FAA) hydrolase family protein [Pseudooceanicola antarcticus]|uniref:Fumarylacetoacetate (FAA) hydrolase family protein n=1 Tax=Pseudooceanicola antarcticus TaxID=1247613 RepID=A0A285JFM6_9RHOB|nr:fumarylacetoacetate hydrolase family protein [Pseudooceanicola antarcticus]PJE31087.1 fumarylacetoacetate hydrolase [Pseudooceanicola antarcticus]SNY58607.1 Fumarylacetoacetate (FAA) hydrolase family protein [Pseudooceanicola antarcticus]
MTENKTMALAAKDILPDAGDATLLGRVWSKSAEGPCPVLLRDGEVLDLTHVAPTMAELLEIEDLAGALSAGGPSLGPLEGFLDQGDGKGSAGQLLAPCDLQAVKAAGVTFAGSMIERVIEERAKGDPAMALSIRSELAEILGGNLRGLVPGSDKAAEVKAHLQKAGLWSQYLEVGIGPDAEIFTKAQPMSAVGCGAEIGIHPRSHWNNPEPEVVLAINSRGQIRGATLGNDVNLRDFEGRSALLLGKAKDNNAAAAMGPFIRLLDDGFALEELSTLRVSLEITGEDGFLLSDHSDMAQISRQPADLAAQLLNATHQYPDGAMLYLGTMFAPTKDRDGEGMGFTHKTGDIVSVSSPALGRLVNRVHPCDAVAPWSFGTSALMRNLAERGALK